MLLTKDNLLIIFQRYYYSARCFLAQVTLCLPDIPDAKKSVNQVRLSHMTMISSTEINLVDRNCIFREDFFAVHNVQAHEKQRLKSRNLFKVLQQNS